MFAEAATDPAPWWATGLLSFIVLLGFVAQIVLPLLQRHMVSDAAKTAARKAAEESGDVKKNLETEAAAIRKRLEQTNLAHMEKLDSLVATVDETHKIVNSQREAMMAKIEMLEKLLTDKISKKGDGK